MALASSRSEFYRAARGDYDQTLAMKARRHWIFVCDDLNGFDSDACGFDLGSASGRGIFIAPVEGTCVGMDPEEAAMAVAGKLSPASFSGVFPQVLANHCLCNSLNHARVRATLKPVPHTHAINSDVEPLVKLRSE